jgi:hypothetical protein
MAGKLSRLRGAIDDITDGLKGWSHWGKVATGIGFAIVTVSAGLDDFHQHGNVGRAAAVGLLHGALATGGAYLGGAIGGTLGALCGPAAFVCSPVLAFAGASVGGAFGDWVAGQIVNHIDDGSISHAASGAAHAVGNVVSGLANAWGSIFP